MGRPRPARRQEETLTARRGPGPAAGPGPDPVGVRVLVLGIGNPGRGDDGLGARAAARVSALGLPGVTADANYQLNVEDALACSMHDVVVFIDAARGLRKPFTMARLGPEAAVPAMTHSLGPGAVLALSRELYGRAPEAWLLAIGGRRWEMGEGLSPRASDDLDEAVAFLAEFLAGLSDGDRRIG
ncbi:MAG TPA: hydrogenase maturation protease [Acidobacteriota bacterium]|nr:hydrogenase maturation protease [Acidobacteriota bacterium]